MTRSRRIRVGAILLAIAVVSPFSWGASAQPFSANVVGTGTLVAWLSGLDFQASITGEVRLTAEVTLGGRLVMFSAEGTLRGFGVRGITTLISEGWIGLSATGRTADGEPIEIRELLYVWRKTLIPLRAGDPLLGTHHAVVLFRGETYPFHGEFSGSAEGGLEPAETPGTIQLGGTGKAHLGGNPGERPASIPLDHPALTAEFLQYVVELGLGI